MAYKKVEMIKVPYGKMNEIAKHFGVTYQTVYDALHFTTHSERALIIRKEAIENYRGQLVPLYKKTR